LSAISAFSGISKTEFVLIHNSPPQIGTIADQTTDINVAISSISLTATDVETADCSLNITFTSSNTSLISSSNVSYTCASGTFYISLTPITNQTGNSTLSVIISDSGNLTASTSFSLTVSSGPTPPELSSISDQPSASGTISFTVLTTNNSDLTITAISSDQAIIPYTAINLSGADTNTITSTFSANVSQELTLTFSPTADQHDRISITIIASNPDGLTSSTEFSVIVSPPGSGNSLSFDGSSDYIEIPYNENLNLDVFTATIWAKVEGGAGTFRTVFASRNGSPISGYNLYATNANIWSLWYGNGIGWWAVDGPSVVLNEWTHFAITSNGTDTSLYVNGIFASSRTVNLSLNTSKPFRFGAGNNESTPDYFFPGQIDEFRYYNIALTQEQIRDVMCKKIASDETGLVAYFRFDSSSGSSLLDLSGNNYNGTLMSMSDASWITSGAPIGDTSVLDYDGSNASDFSVNTSHASGDSFTATGDGGTFEGIHLYLVNEAPNVTTMPGSFVEMDTTHYYGVFPVGENVTYSITYDYENNDISDQNLDQLAFRANNADMDWSSLMTVRNTDSKTISCQNISYTEGYLAGEFIYGTEIFNLSTSDVIAHYPLNGNILDESGNGNDGDLLNGGMSSTTDRYGNANSAYQFDGSDDFITLTEFNIPETCTVSFWFNIQSDSQNQNIVGKHTIDDNNILLLGYYGTPRFFTVNIKDAEYHYGGIVLGYHHATAVIQKQTSSTSLVTVYMDGKILWQNTLNSVLGSDISGSRWVLGQDWDSGGSKTDFFEGTLDEVTFYNRALNASEVRYLYENITDLLPQINPEIGMVSNLQTDQNTAIQSIPLSSTFSDTLDCNIELTFTSSNTTLVAVNNISYTCQSGIFYLSLTPTTDQSGSATISITAGDAWGITASTTFDLTVNTFIDTGFPPSISSISSQNSAAGTVSFTVSDAESGQLTITATSSDETIIPYTGIHLSGSTSNVLTTTVTSNVSQDLTIAFTPIEGLHDRVTITIIATDSNELTTSTDFTVIASPPGPGNALTFDGSNDYVRLQQNYTWPESFSIMAWIYLEDYAYVASILSAGGNPSVAEFRIYNDKLEYLQADGSTISAVGSNTTFEKNRWYHVAVVKNVSNITLYVNGAIDNTGTLGTLPSAVDVAIGALITNGAPQANYYHKGQIDEVSFWSTPLPTNSIQDSMCKRITGSETGLLYYYRFDHSSGTTLTDLSGNENHGTLINMDNTDWVSSGAALGDVSVYDYTGSVGSDFVTSLSYADGDYLSAIGVSGTYTGIQLYLVNEAPGNTSQPSYGWSSIDTSHYWGIFPVGIDTTYAITYSYSGNTYVSTEENLSMAGRTNNSSNWHPTNAQLSIESNTLSQSV
ncbi:hypothetical protein MHK_006275, partial [Candidatus Magnetomorum sp. HK-1]